jgi:thiol-disulfide isomerase/thioredoxin
LEKHVADNVDRNRRRLIGAAALTVAGAWLGSQSSVQRMIAASFRGDGELRALDRATEWLTGPPLTEVGLRGKVVLVNFWTYTCINWLRQLPYVRAWADKYREQGLIVIGVHSPEFSFEKQVEGVRRAVKDSRITYPVVIDNDHAIWRGFRNQYWPALYFLDVKGQLRHEHFGEGQYEQSEVKIQQLLAEAGARGGSQGLVAVDASGPEAAADWTNLKSPENYLGYQRTRYFTSPGGVVPDSPHAYVVPTRLRLNNWALSGEWTVDREAAVLHRAGGRVACRFHARDLHLVMRRTGRSTPVRFRVLIDGVVPGASHGGDVDELGRGIVTDGRLYQLIRQPSAISERQFEIEFLDRGVEALAFTFG